MRILSHMRTGSFLDLYAFRHPVRIWGPYAYIALLIYTQPALECGLTIWEPFKRSENLVEQVQRRATIYKMAPSTRHFPNEKKLLSEPRVHNNIYIIIIYISYIIMNSWYVADSIRYKWPLFFTNRNCGWAYKNRACGHKKFNYF